MALKRLKTGASVSTKEAIAEVFNKLEAEGCDPITEMARLAMDDDTPLEKRIIILKELAAYVAPKRRAVEFTGDDDQEGVKVTIVKYTKDITGEVGRMLSDEGKAEVIPLNKAVGE